MLLAIDYGRVEGCDYRQPDIVHFETTVESLVENGLAYVFYDHNATLDFAKCYNDVKDLDKIDWALFFEDPKLDGYCQFFQNNRNIPKYVKRRETRQAEFLVHKSVPLKLMDKVGIYNEAKADEVRRIFEEADLDLEVVVKQSWYF